MRLSPKEEPHYFIWGSLVHNMSEGLELEFPLANVLAILTEWAHTFYPEQTHEQVDAMIGALPYVRRGHQLKWHNDPERYELLATEQVFELPLPNGIIFKGKIDRVERDTVLERIQIRERKTAARTGLSYTSALQLDSQAKGYVCAGQQALGFNLDTIMFDVFKKPCVPQRPTETDQAYYERIQERYVSQAATLFERYPIRYTASQLENYLFDLTQVSDQICRCYDEGYWAKHHPKNRHGGCPYFQICAKEMDIDEMLQLPQFTIRDEIHPELDNKNELDWTKYTHLL
jgi:hypothetical protein